MTVITEPLIFACMRRFESQQTELGKSVGVILEVALVSWCKYVKHSLIPNINVHCYYGRG